MTSRDRHSVADVTSVGRLHVGNSFLLSCRVYEVIATNLGISVEGVGSLVDPYFQ